MLSTSLFFHSPLLPGVLPSHIVRVEPKCSCTPLFICRRWDICTSQPAPPSPASSSKPRAPCIFSQKNTVFMPDPSHISRKVGINNLPASFARLRFNLHIVHSPSIPLFHRYHRSRSSRIDLLGEGREQPSQYCQKFVLQCADDCSSRSLPDEAGPRVAAGVAKVDDQGKVAVVDTNLSETNDAGDALLLW